MAIGDMSNIVHHECIEICTLNKGYYEAAFEINKSVFPFGLPFSYRYGGNHLPNLENSIAV